MERDMQEPFRCDKALHLGLASVAADKDHGKIGAVRRAKLGKLRRELAAWGAPACGEVQANDLAAERSGALLDPSVVLEDRRRIIVAEKQRQDSSRWLRRLL